jgi:hypothetical protein
MGLIKQHLKKESLKTYKDAYLLVKLSKVNDKGTITYDEWQDSGRFVDRKSFEAHNPDENLHVDCTDIVMYFGGIYIQLLKSGEFFIDSKVSGKTLDAIEKTLWDKNLDLFWG